MKLQKKELNMFISCVSIDSLLKIKNKYHPQVYLEQCKYEIKKKELKNFSDHEVDFDSDYDSDLGD